MRALAGPAKRALGLTLAGWPALIIFNIWHPGPMEAGAVEGKMALTLLVLTISLTLLVLAVDRDWRERVWEAIPS